MTHHHKIRLRCHTVALVIETIGTFFIFLDTVRLNSMVGILGYTSFNGEPEKFHAWYYHSAPFGFLLLLVGILLSGVCLWLEHASLGKASEIASSAKVSDGGSHGTTAS